MKKVGAGYKVKIGDLRDAYNLATKNVSEFNKAVDSSQDLVGQAQKKNQQLQQQGITGAETPDEAALKKAQQAAEKAANQQQQLAMDAAKRQNDLDKARFEHLITMNESDFDHWKSLQDDKFNYEIAGMNSIEARQRKFQKDLQDIEIRRIETIRKAELETAKAVQESQAAARVSAAAGGGVTGLYQGSTGISSGAHFDIRRADRSRITEAEARALLDPSVSRQLQMTSGYGRRVPPVPGASSFHAGIDLAGPANTPLNLAPGYSLQGVGLEGGLGYTANVRGPQGEMYKVGHLQPPGASYTRQRRAEGAGGKQDVTQVNATYKATEQLTNVQNAYDLALKQTATTIKSNVASIFPVAELQLETSLMKIRNQLQLQGMPAEYIKYKEELFKAEYEAAEAVKNHQENISEFERTRDAYTKKQQEGVELTAKERQELDYLNKQIALNKEGMAALTEQQKAYNIAALESAIATMKQADALKAMEEVSGRINDAVEGVTDTYKSMFKEIAMGGDSVEALKKAQQALADQFLTMVFDMAMKPVEESMKNTLSKMFGVPTEKEKREESIKKMEEQLTQLKLIEANTAVTAGKVPASGATPSTAPVPGQTTAAGTTGGFLTGTAALQTLPFDGQTSGMLQTLPFNGESGFLSSLGINSEDMAASMAESAGAFSEQLGKVDASVFESANALGTAGTELGKEGAAGKKWHESLGQAVGGLGMAAGAVMGIVAGINQIKEGGTSNVLGGIGMIASMAGSLLGSFGGLFGGGAGASSIVQGVDMPVSQMPAGMAFANGGIAFGGFRAFANGGTVSGPTLGLVGEGKYNEAVVPLPDGRSIPVQLGGRSARDMMGGNAPGMPQAPSLSMKFETTKINGVEYVSREQLEQAMAETRRASIAGGAQRGMSMTLDKIKQSPSTRSSIGIR
jgi:murein DD-endopeptidase MepM/ murein hydrolase activator NlpD